MIYNKNSKRNIVHMNSSLNAVTCSKVLSFFSSVYIKKKLFITPSVTRDFYIGGLLGKWEKNELGRWERRGKAGCGSAVGKNAFGKSLIPDIYILACMNTIISLAYFRI